MRAVILQILLIAYHQFTTTVDLYPYNGVRSLSRKERVAEQIVNGILMGLPIVGSVFNINPLVYYGVAYYFILFAVECATWWVPYFLGASPKWLEIYLRVHAGTIGILPGRDKRTAPNLEHLVLMLLTLLTASATLIRFQEMHPQGYPRAWIPIAIGAAAFLGTSLQQVQGRKANDSNTSKL